MKIYILFLWTYIIITNKEPDIKCIKKLLLNNKKIYLNDLFLSKNILRIDKKIEQFLIFINEKLNEKKSKKKNKSIKLIQIDDIDNFFKLKDDTRKILLEFNNNLKSNNFLNNEVNYLILNLFYNRLPELLKKELNNEKLGIYLRKRFKNKTIKLFKFYFDYNRFLNNYQNNKIFLNNFKETYLQLIQAKEFYNNYKNYDKINIINILSNNFFFNKFKYIEKNIFFKFLNKLNFLILTFDKFLFKKNNWINIKLKKKVNFLSNKFTKIVVDEILNSTINFFTIDNDDIKNIFIENLNLGFNLKQLLKDDIDSLFDNFELTVKNQMESEKTRILEENNKYEYKVQIKNKEIKDFKLTINNFMKNYFYEKYFKNYDKNNFNPIIDYYCNKEFNPKIKFLKKLFCDYFNHFLINEPKEFIENTYINKRFLFYVKILNKKIFSNYMNLFDNFEEINLSILNIFYGKNLYNSFDRILKSYNKLLKNNMLDLKKQIRKIIKNNIIYLEIYIRKKIYEKIGKYYDYKKGYKFYLKFKKINLLNKEIKNQLIEKIRFFITDKFLYNTEKLFFIKKIKSSFVNYYKINKDKKFNELAYHQYLNLFNIIYFDYNNDIDNELKKCNINLKNSLGYCESIYGKNKCEYVNNFYTEKCPYFYKRKGTICEFDCSKINLKNKGEYCIGDDLKNSCSKEFYFAKKNVCFKPNLFFTNFIFWPYEDTN